MLWRELLDRRNHYFSIDKVLRATFRLERTKVKFKTNLARRLCRLRLKAIKKGLRLMTAEEVLRYVRDLRSGEHNCNDKSFQNETKSSIV